MVASVGAAESTETAAESEIAESVADSQPVVPIEPEFSGLFVDVSVTSDSYDSIMLMWENGIMMGTSANTFEPDAPITRAMAATVLYRAARTPQIEFADVFNDVEGGQWYSDAIMWTAAAGITEGFEDGTFKPNEFVSREQFILMMYRFSGLGGYGISARTDLGAMYSDADDISEWALDAISCAAAMGLLTGIADASLEPGAFLTRGQCSGIVTRGG